MFNDDISVYSSPGIYLHDLLIIIFSSQLLWKSIPAFSYLRITKLNIVNIWLDGSRFCDSFQVINVMERYMLLVSLIEKLKYWKYSVSLSV
jgi:hypothetical protein